MAGRKGWRVQLAKTVYSLVLSDEVVAAIDIMAAGKGHSRSYLINHILAEHASLLTPEVEVQGIIAAVKTNACFKGFRLSANGHSKVTFTTAINYKYNPALTYSVELGGTEGLGKLRIALRSQNQQVLDYIELFFKLWYKLEGGYLVNPPTGRTTEIGPRRYTRILRKPEADCDSAIIGAIIADYIGLIDRCMKTFFTHSYDAQEALAETERCYRQGLVKKTGLELL